MEELSLILGKETVKKWQNVVRLMKLNSVGWDVGRRLTPLDLPSLRPWGQGTTPGLGKG